MKTVLVTGGAGFIGSTLCETLLEKDNYVLCLDNFLTSSVKNIEHIQSHSHLELIRHDITQPLFLECDEIYNLACPASPIHYQKNPIKTIKCNTVGIVNLLGLAKRNGARVLQASTSEVYGDPLEHPQKETYWGNVNPIGPRACYDEGKRMAEALCTAYNEYNGVDIRLVRIFNTYGPRMAVNDGRVISNFIIQALQDKDITIYGDGSQTRSFQYVTDLVDGMIKMMEQDEFIGPVNLGNPNEVTIKKLAETIIERTNSASSLSYHNLPIDDPKVRKPDITLANERLGWNPIVSMDVGLDKTIEYFSGVM